MHYREDKALTATVIQKLLPRRAPLRSVKVAHSFFQRIRPVAPFRNAGVTVTDTKDSGGHDTDNICLGGTYSIIVISETMMVALFQITQNLENMGRNQHQVSVECLARHRNDRVRNDYLAGHLPTAITDIALRIFRRPDDYRPVPQESEVSIRQANAPSFIMVSSFSHR